MNRPVNPADTAAATLLSAAMRSAVLSHIDDPAAAEKTLTERVRARYRGDHPEFAIAEARIEENQAVLHGQRELRERHMEAMRGGDLMRERLVGPRDGKLTLFDFGLFAGIAAVGIGGNFVALSNVATYVADSGVIDSLTDNFYRALFVSAIPFSGSAVVKAIGAFQADNKAERAFNLRIARYACGFVAAHIIALALFFAPHKMELAALQQAMANGVSPTNPIVAILRDIASYFVLGTGLFAEMLIAPVVISYAHKLHRAGREVVAKLHDEQEVHRQIIEGINSKIDPIVERLGRARAEVDKHASALAEMIEATLHLHREAAADLKAAERRAKDEFFSNRSKGGSR
jgi:hypothetical protein